MEYFSSDEERSATKKGSTTEYSYFARSLAGVNNYYAVSGGGSINTANKNSQLALRPAIVLPYDTAVVNTQYESSPAVKLYDTLGGIYVFKDGKWKECKT